MTKISLDQIKQLRAKTKAGVMDCRKALEESAGDLKKAEEWLRQKGIEGAGKRTDRPTSGGVLEVYTHSDGRIVSVVELRCETDFVARTEEFRKLAHELAMQVAAMNPKDVKELLKQPWIREEKKTVEELVKETGGKVGENIVVKRIARFGIGEEE
jgi:elongation factor Ts